MFGSMRMRLRRGSRGKREKRPCEKAHGGKASAELEINKKRIRYAGNRNAALMQWGRRRIAGILHGELDSSRIAALPGF